MSLEQLPMLQQLMLVLAAMVLFTSFVLLEQVRQMAAIHAFAWQGVLVAMVTAIVAASGEHAHLYSLMPWRRSRSHRSKGARWGIYNNET